MIFFVEFNAENTIKRHVIYYFLFILLLCCEFNATIFVSITLDIRIIKKETHTNILRVHPPVMREEEAR